MARGTALSDLMEMLKAEIGYSLEDGVAVAEDARLKILLSTTQKWLAADFDWPFLKRTGDVVMSAGDRAGVLPTTLDYERPVMVFSLYQNLWKSVTYGISPPDFNVWNSDNDERQDPVVKIQYATDTTFEVWPIPATDTIVRFTGRKRLNNLEEDGDTADLDDLLIVLFTAAELLANQKQADAQAKLARAQARLNTLKSVYPAPLQVFKLGGEPNCRCERIPVGVSSGQSGGGGGTTANTVSGSDALGSGVSSGSIAYNFGSVPVAIVLTVQSPAGGLVLVASLDGAAGPAGFDFNLSGETDSADYVLHWEATL